MGGLFFVASCDRCHRMIEKPIGELGCPTVCEHCGKTFLARDPDSQSAAINDPLRYWIDYTDHGLASPESEQQNEWDVFRKPR
jgi:hypothetical protein